MQQAELNVVSREVGLKSSVKKIRNSGLVPANVYGYGKKNAFCAFSDKEVRKIFNNDFSSNFILTLKSDAADLTGKKVVIKSLERNPETWKILHADFYEIAFDKPLTVSLPVHYVGTPTGVKDGGGILQIIRRTVQVRALPGDIPEKVDVNIAGLELGGSLHIKDAKFPEKLKILDSAEFTLVSVVEPEKEEVVVAATPAEGAAAAAGTAAATGTAAAAASGTAASAAGAKAPDTKAAKAEAPKK